MAYSAVQIDGSDRSSSIVLPQPTTKVADNTESNCRMVSPQTTLAHWPSAFLDVRYEKDAQGPDTYDCWSFVRRIQRERFGRDVPERMSPPSLLTIAKAMPAWASEFGWVRTDTPQEGDAVFMSQLKHPTHIGVVVKPRPLVVLHCTEGGAFLADEFHLKVAGWRLRGFYTPASP